MAQQVTEAARHVESRIAGILGIHPMVRVAIEDNTATGFLNASLLILQVGLVVACQCRSFPLASDFCAEDSRAVSHVSHGDLVGGVVVDGDGGGGSGHLGIHLLHPVRRAHQALCLLKSLSQGRAPLPIGGARIFDDKLRKVVLDEIGDVMTFLSMTIKDTVEREILRFEHAPRVLVGAFGLQALPAGVANAMLRGIELIT
mmetsp:Transcript_9268/g.22240  ORF Transcript_9268/g.22240 Transcript_9268/m.22240 type:complete len:201 (-) Transcript_9268:356-958(-)